MDETLAAVVRSADADPNIVAAFLHGSRAVGHERPDSDYDVWFVTAEERALEEIQNVEAASVTIDQLRETAPTWWTDGLVQGRVLFDRTGGELESILARLAAAEDVERPYDAYLNASSGARRLRAAATSSARVCMSRTPSGISSKRSRRWTESARDSTTA